MSQAGGRPERSASTSAARGAAGRRTPSRRTSRRTPADAPTRARSARSARPARKPAPARPAFVRSIVQSRLTLPIALVLSAAIVLGVILPLGSLSSVQASLGRSRAELAALERSHAALRSEVRSLQSPAVIDQLARERFGMVRKGQEALAIVPSATTDGQQPSFARGFGGVAGAAATPAVPITPLEAMPPPLGAPVEARPAAKAGVVASGGGGGILGRLIHDLASAL